MAYGVFESNKMLSTNGGAHIVDAKVLTETDNGSVGYVEDGELKVFATATLGKKVPVIVDQVPMSYDTSHRANQRRDNITNAANTIVRCRMLGVGDVFSLSADAISGTPAVGKYLVLANNSKKLTIANEPANGLEIVITGTHKTGLTLTTDAHVYGATRTMYECEVRSVELA